MKHDRKFSRSHEQHLRDVRSRELEPGSWVRFSDHAAVQHIGKLGRIVDWNDDGWNSRRAPRNKKVKVAVEPHLHEVPVIYCAKIQEFLPVTDMEVIAESARG